VSRSRSGFTLVEVLIAVTVLSVGIIALAGNAAMATRMIGRGKSDTQAAQLATLKVDSLRARAYATDPRCTALVNGTSTASEHVTLSWTVTVPATGVGRNLTVSSAYKTPRGTHTEVLTTYIEC
jgi:prepilin-type N-terminal cleavage/methylation domain-containing protein